jgi:hypothetical protein
MRLSFQWFEPIPVRRYVAASPHGVTTEDTNTDVFAAVRTSDLSRCLNSGSRIAPNILEHPQKVGRADGTIFQSLLVVSYYVQIYIYIYNK